MNILIISPFFPYPLSQGGKIRVFNIIKYLSKNHKITLACLSPESSFINGTNYGPLKDYCEEIMVIYRKPSVKKDLFRFLIGPNPFNYLRYSSSELRKTLAELAKRKSFDLVQIEFSMMWQYAEIFTGIPVVLDAHNIEYEVIRQVKNTYKNPVRKFLYAMEEKKLRDKEEQAWRGCSLCFTVSDKERDVITSFLGHSNKVLTIPNGVDLERFEFLPKVGTDKQLLFLGGMDYIPNLDSALYLLKEIFPLIQSGMPDVKLDIVGRELWRVNDYSSIRGVEFHENVPDILPCLRKADVLVVPLRYGAGTRIKILEAMAAGLPVVTTSKGCEGIGVKHGEHLLIADSPYAFAEAVETLLDDTKLRNSIVLNARNLIEEKYSWQIIVDRMQGELSKVT